MTFTLHRYASGLACAAMMLTACASPLRAACESAQQDTARVDGVIDARTLRLDDGREVRLSGIEMPPGDGTRQQATLASLARGRDVSLHGDDDAPDRYGQQRAMVFVAGSSTSLQAELVARGEAMVAVVADAACRAALLADENTARTARRGLWADPAALKNAERPDDILTGLGRFAVVEGTVSSARQAGATFYINFGRRWTEGFAITISRRMMPSFAAAGIDLMSLKDKRVRVRGWIERRGGPRIEASRPGQIELIAAANGVASISGSDNGGN